VKNTVDTIFFTPDVFAARRRKHPVILHRFRLRENASYTCGASVAALTSGMVGKSEKKRSIAFFSLRMFVPRDGANIL
jgi:hypothetical protein